MNYRNVIFCFIEKLANISSSNFETRMELLRLAWLEAAAMERKDTIYNFEYELVFTDLLKHIHYIRHNKTTFGRLQAFDYIINPAINDKGLPKEEVLIMIDGYHKKKKIL